jgi:predicted 3-demethylubiquinone-9 3-methyltransferase (glyoxalase superfamily)
MATLKQTIVPHLWYDTQAVEAAEFYTSIFDDSRITNTTTINGTPSGTVDIVAFGLLGQEFMAISAGPVFSFNESISFMVKCDTQEEIDHYWEKLTADGGEPGQCGWLKDKFGLSWQVVPSNMGEMMSADDPEATARVTQAFLKMTKFDLAELRQAREGE